MITLAIDPGSQRTGFSLLRQASTKLHYLTSGSIVLDPKLSFAARLRDLYEDLSHLCQKHRPHHLAVEKVFFAKNAQSALKLGQVRGVILLIAAQFDLEIHEYSATQVKSSVCGAGRAQKSQIEHMIRLLLKLPSNFQFSSSDQSDALAIGLTHLQSWRPPRRVLNDRTTSRPSHL
jgi:crossover junction endodeoxyribonuclease RuvC